MNELTVAYTGKHLDEAGVAELHYAKTPKEAVDQAHALAADPTAYSKGAEKEFRS